MQFKSELLRSLSAHAWKHADPHDNINENVYCVQTFSINILKYHTKSEFIFSSEK